MNLNVNDEQKYVRRVKAGQPPADLDLWEEDRESEQEMSDAAATVALLAIIVILVACAALVLRVV